MSECNSVEMTNIYSSLSDQTKITLNEINKIRDSFNFEIQERKLMSTKLNKQIVAFDYFDELLIALSAISGGVSIISIVSVIGAAVGKTSTSPSLVQFLATGIIKNY